MEGRKLAKLSWNDWMDDTVDANDVDDLHAEWMSYVNPISLTLPISSTSALIVAISPTCDLISLSCHAHCTSAFPAHILCLTSASSCRLLPPHSSSSSSSFSFTSDRIEEQLCTFLQSRVHSVCRMAAGAEL